MNIADYTEKLRNLLGVSNDLAATAILELIKAEGWEPDLYSEQVDGDTLWACPIARGIFRTVQRDGVTGRMGQAGSPTRTIAALKGLARARFELPVKELYEFISSANISEEEVRETATGLSTVDASMSLVIEGSDKPQNLRSRISQSIQEWKPKTVADRQGYLTILFLFLSFLAGAGVDDCRSKPSDTVVNNFFLQLNIDSEGQQP